MNLVVSRCRVAAAVAAFALVAATATMLVPPTLAAFTGTTANAGNTWNTDTLAPPTAFTATCVNSGRVDLSWLSSPTANVTGYRIERRREGESDFTPLATVTPRTATAYSDQATPFPSSLLSLLGTVTVTYQIRAEVAGSSWRSASAQASASGNVTSVLGIKVFSCN
ncbi:MAG: fibronectin type III domain-containing protein [Egibacteraceae bacterium]